MRFTEEYFPDFADAMNEVEAAVEMKRPFDDKTYHLISFALAFKYKNPIASKAHFHAAMKAGASTRELAYVISMTEFETMRMDDTWIHDALGDWTQLTRDDFDTGCRCGIVRRY